MATTRVWIEVAGQERAISVEPLGDGRYRLTEGGRARVVDARRVAAFSTSATWSLLPEGGGAGHLVDVEGAAPALTVTVGGVSLPLRVTDARGRVASRAVAAVARSGPQAIRSPMPGKVVKVLVQLGDEVKSGQGMVVVEAMKMENELKAPRDGRVKELSAREGQAVESGQVLATVE